MSCLNFVYVLAHGVPNLFFFLDLDSWLIFPAYDSFSHSHPHQITLLSANSFILCTFTYRPVKIPCQPLFPYPVGVSPPILPVISQKSNGFRPFNLYNQYHAHVRDPSIFCRSLADAQCDKCEIWWAVFSLFWAIEWWTTNAVRMKYRILPINPPGGFWNCKVNLLIRGRAAIRKNTVG